MSEPLRRSTRPRKTVSFAEQPEEGEDPVSNTPAQDEEESDFEAGDAAEEQETAEDAAGEAEEAEDPEPYRTRENGLVKKYGSLYAADEEKQRRKELYNGHFQDFLVRSEQSKLKSDHLAQRKKMWTEHRQRINSEIDALEAKIAGLRAKEDQMNVAEAELEEKIGEEADEWEGNKVKLAEWQAFFDLERDEIDT